MYNKNKLPANVNMDPDENEIWEYAVIGDIGQIKDRPPEQLRTVWIGTENVIRNFVTIDEGVTIRNRNFIMSHVHIGHDYKIGSENVIGSGSVFAGHGCMMDYVTVGIHCCFHQYVMLGSYSMIGMGSVVVEDVPPFMKCAGNPARILGYNTIGIERAHFSKEYLERIYKGTTPVQLWFVQNHKRREMKKL